MRRSGDGDRRTSQEVEEVVENGTEPGNRGGESRHGREDGAEISARRAAAQRIKSGSDMADAARSVHGSVGGSREQMVEANPGLEAKTLFEALQREHPGRFADGQLRTLQRRLKHWRATEGPGREVFFAQQHVPGRLGQSDFTHMSELGITIGGQSFPHLLYHFVLTYSNWETASCATRRASRA